MSKVRGVHPRQEELLLISANNHSHKHAVVNVKIDLVLRWWEQCCQSACNASHSWPFCCATMMWRAAAAQAAMFVLRRVLFELK
mmetsp:Transcript_26636/g.51302  ORF Transcript_26636/g.51302 Transcript_26636/m.51302 type:complete len:84 (+) Transcript_26636:2435-2686(+)